MNNQEVVQALKEIFDECGTEIVQNRKVFMSAVYDLLREEWKYKDERTVLKLAMESNAIPILLSASPITSDSAERAVEQIRKDMHMDSEDAKFVVQCVVTACGYNPDIVTENEKRRQEEEAERIRKEEERKREEEQKRQEEERKRREEEQKRQEEERKKQEEEQKRQEKKRKQREERKRREEEQKRQEEERKKQEEEQKRQEKERKQREEEQKRQEEERKRLEEEQKRQEEERKKQVEERNRQGEEQKQQIMNKKKQWEILLAIVSIPGVMWGFLGIMSWVLGRSGDDDISDLMTASLILVACQCYLVFKTSKRMLAAWIGIVIGLIGIGCLSIIL